MNNTRVAVMALLGLVLAACGSIPLGTMWKMYRMGPEGLLDANAEEVRAAVLSETWLIDSKSFDEGRLALELTRADESSESFAFLLEDVSVREQLQLGSPGPGQRWRVYAIEAGDLQPFQQMQRQLAVWLETEEFKGGSMHLAVNFDGAMEEASPASSEAAASEGGSEPYPEEVQFRIDLKLQNEEGFFPLVRDYMMPVTVKNDDD